MATTTRTILSITLLVGLGISFAGCGGPTRAGLEARAEARDRMGLVNAQISYDQAKRAFEVGDFDRALRDVNHAIDRFSEVPAYHLLQGRILLEMHRLEHALHAFDSAVEIAQSRGQRASSTDTSLQQAHYFAGIVFQRWSNHEKAHERYFQAATIDPSNAQYLLAAAEAKIAVGKYDEAFDLIAPRLAYFEHNAAMRHLLGHIALLQGDAAYAAQQFTQARLLNPDDPMLAEELAWAQYAAGKYAHALESLQQLSVMTRGRERRVDLVHLEARCLLHLERHVDARALYMELTRLSPTDPEVWIELGALAWELGDQRRVAESATRIISLAPNRFEGYALRGIYFRDNGRLSDAENLLRQAANRSPNNALPHLLLAQVLEQSDRHEEALMLYGKVVSMFPNNREAFMLFGRLSQSSNQQLSAVHGE